MKRIYITFIMFVLPVLSFSQSTYTEDFESQTPGNTSFTSNGQMFNIISPGSETFSISNSSGAGWNGTSVDNQFIDNQLTINSNTKNPTFTIASSDGTSFTLKNMWLFLSDHMLDENTVSGTVTITGKLSGATVFTAVSSSGFNTTYTLSDPEDATDNGYTLINMSSYGGSDNSATKIDEFTISVTGGYQYVGLDAMTWATVPESSSLPVTLQSFTGFLQNNIANLQWHTSVEVNFNRFAVEKSIDGKNYTETATIAAKGNNSQYTYSLPQPEPTAYYRLKLVNNDGSAAYSSSIALSQNNESRASVYPNPAKDHININVADASTVNIYNATGKLIETKSLQAGVNTIDISGLNVGVYYGTVNGQKIKFVKE